MIDKQEVSRILTIIEFAQNRPYEHMVCLDALEKIRRILVEAIRDRFQITRNPKNNVLTIVCAWCKKVIKDAGPDAPVSHTICEKCLKKLLAEE